MITLKGVEVSAKIKLQVQEMLEKMNGYVPTAAIVRVGERPDDLSYEKGVIKKLASFGMEVKQFAFPEDISEEDFLQEFKKINADESIDGILLFMPLPKHMNGKVFEDAIDPAKDLDGISPVNRAKIFAGEELVSEYIESVRMRELLWSLNACIGVTYPLCRFLSLYAEAGIDYYIDNGSSIETIRSEKPFNVNLQAGFRFGF